MEPLSITFEGFGSSFLKLTITEVFGFPKKTCHWGGYEANCKILLKSGGFSINDQFYISTGQFYEFFKSLESAYSTLEGRVQLESIENNLNLFVLFKENGMIEIEGTYRDFSTNNKLLFGISSDQSFLNQTLNELAHFVGKYGGMNGIEDHLL